MTTPGPVTLSRLFRFGTLLGVIVVIAAACGSSSKSGSTSSTTSGSKSELTTTQLNGKKFESTSVSGHALAPGTHVTLTFEGDDLGASAGCNSMSATYAITNGTLKWTGPVRSTLMACPPAETAQDEWLSKFLTTGAAASLSGERLTLTQSGTTIELAQQM